MTLVVGLGHRARQGKDSVANMWKELLPQIVHLYSFATALKEYCRDNHAVLLAQWQSERQTTDVPESKTDPIYGCSTILQWYGTDVVRKQDPLRWIREIDSRITADNPQIAVITDVRFENEAEYIKQKAGYLVEVIRRNEDGTQYLDPGRDSNHISERSLNEYMGWDFYVWAKTGDLSVLREKAFAVLNNILTDSGDTYDDIRRELWSNYTAASKSSERKFGPVCWPSPTITDAQSRH